MSEQSGSWQPDPSGRHQYRYWDGSNWTDQVSDGGVASTDPLSPVAPSGAARPAASGFPPAAPVSAGGNAPALIVGIVAVAAVIGAGAWFFLMKDDDGGGGNEELISQMVADGVPRDVAECFSSELDGHLSAGEIRTMMEDPNWMPSPAQEEAFAEAAEHCGLYDHIIEGDSGGFEEGSTYGDNPTLDGLWDACEGGDMGACDELYNVSEIGSGYERFGDTCGGRQPEGTGEYCDQ